MAEHTPEPAPAGPTLASIFGTEDTSAQIKAAQVWQRAAMTPAFCLTLYFDPRIPNGFDFKLVGPDTPFVVLREMLARALERVNEMEVDARVQQKVSSAGGLPHEH